MEPSRPPGPVDLARNSAEAADPRAAARLVRDTGAGSPPELAPLLAVWLDGDSERITGRSISRGRCSRNTRRPEEGHDHY